MLLKLSENALIQAQHVHAYFFVFGVILLLIGVTLYVKNRLKAEDNKTSRVFLGTGLGVLAGLEAAFLFMEIYTARWQGSSLAAVCILILAFSAVIYWSTSEKYQ